MSFYQRSVLDGLNASGKCIQKKNFGVKAEQTWMSCRQYSPPPRWRSVKAAYLCLIFLFISSYVTPPPGIGGCLCGVPVLCAWAGVVLLQPSEDCPSLWTPVPPAQCGGRLPGSHPCHSPPAAAAAAVSHHGAKNLPQEVRRRVWVPKGRTTPGSPRAR